MRPSARIVTTRNSKKLENIIIKGGTLPPFFFGGGKKIHIMRQRKIYWKGNVLFVSVQSGRGGPQGRPFRPAREIS